MSSKAGIRLKRSRRNYRYLPGPWDGLYSTCIKFTGKQWLKVHIREQGNSCAICGNKMCPPANGDRKKDKSGQCATLDHIVPLVDGGIHIFANTRAVHKKCNSARESEGK